MPPTCKHFLRAALVLLASIWSGAAAAGCTVSPNVATNWGSYSPTAVRVGAPPMLQSRAGLTCPSGVLTLLGRNYVRASFQSANGLRLANADGSGATIGYTLSADPNGAVPIGQNATIDYMQNNLLNVLGLLGSGSADMPFFLRATGGDSPSLGTYTDRITIRWNWYLCQGVNAVGICVLGADSGSGTTVVDVTMNVDPENVVVSMSSATTWDPVNTTSNPRALPGSKRRVTVSLFNPDIVATEGNVTVVAPLDASQSLALDGDGTSGGSPFGFSSSSGAAPVFTYSGAASTTDNVDFSDDGSNWTYVPDANDPASQRRVKAIRFRPQGSIPAGAQIQLSFPVVVR